MSRKRTDLLIVCMALTVMSLLVSNIITNKQASLPWGWSITCGCICIPISYIVDDVLAEVYGFKTARNCTLAAFVAAAIAVVYFQIAIAIPGNELFDAQEAFEAVLGTTWRTVGASFAAYVVGSLANAAIMQRMHDADGESRVAWRCILSTVVGELLDMVIFAVLAFGGTMPWAAVWQIVVDNAGVKILIEVCLYPLVTRTVLRWAKSL